jgi:hypothetical protein
VQFEVDPERLAAELRADEDVVRSLKSNGDVPTAIRPVDVRFRGREAQVKEFSGHVAGEGWLVNQIVPLDQHEWALDITRKQTTESAVLRALTLWALEIEARFGIEYDGWGAVATKP